MRFRFSLQRLLELRIERERAMAAELAHARDAADVEHRAHDVLRSAQESAQRQLATEAAAGPTIGALVSLNYALSRFGEHVAAADARTRAADETVAQKHDALTLAAQARQILDRLRERHLEDYQAEAKSVDRQTMDAVALSRFSRRQDTLTASPRSDP